MKLVSIVLFAALAVLATAKNIPMPEQKMEETHVTHPEVSDIKKRVYTDDMYHPYEKDDLYSIKQHYYPGRYIEFKQQFSPYDFTSKVNAKFNRKYNMDLDTYEKDIKMHKSPIDVDTTHDSDYYHHDAALYKRSMDIPEYSRYYGMDYDYPMMYNKNYMGDFYGKGYPMSPMYPYMGMGMKYNTPMMYNYDYMNSEDMDMKVKQMKDFLKKYEEMKKEKKSSKKDKSEYSSEHMVPTMPMMHMPTYGRQY